MNGEVRSAIRCSSGPLSLSPLRFVLAGDPSVAQGPRLPAMVSDSKLLAFLSTFASVHERGVGQRANGNRLAATVLLVTMLAAASALMPLHLGASSASSATHPTVQKIPAGLARAIRARLGPGPLGLGTAPLVSGIAPAHRGWSVKAPSQSIAAHISRAGSASVSLRGSASTSLEAVSLSTGTTRETLSATSSAHWSMAPTQSTAF